jgi:hypothetical protein
MKSWFWEALSPDVTGEIKKKTSKISGFHGGDYEEWCLLGCYAVWLF